MTVARERFGLANFGIRWLLAMVLVLGIYNPTRFSYYAWLTTPDEGHLSVKALVGVFLLILMVIYLRATWRSLGPIGVTLAALLFGVLIWVIVDVGLLTLERTATVTWVLLVILATIMALGMSWSHVRRRLSGQADVDDVDM